MINIRTKSLQLMNNQSDGLRVCVMRRIRPEYDFDLWIPKLAPSEGLIKSYIIKKAISWNKFTKLYSQKVLKKQKKLIEALVYLSKYYRITFLCWEKSAKRCHRYLLLQKCRNLAPILYRKRVKYN